MKRVFLFILTLAVLSFTAFTAGAQDLQTKGTIRGTVTDPNGAVISGATVAVTGAAGERTTTTSSEGTYEVANLNPGLYTVKVSQSGFKTTSVANTTVFVGKASVVDAKLEIGASSVTVDVTAGNEIDQGSTATSTNLNDQLFQNIPVARGVSSLFYLAPGTSDGLGGGRDNPSISGGSALDNLYVADGVNITDSGFGGIGTFSRFYGALGTGINTSFIKEVQVKTAGFEAQYGQSQGGIVNIITQSGGNEYHGAIYGYGQPKAFEATRKQPDDFPKRTEAGKLLHRENYDFGGDFGGYVPGLRDHMFFFGSFNPSVRRDIVRGAEKNALNSVDSGLRLIRGPAFANRTRVYNYAFKTEYNFNSNHQLTFSIFGDPSKTNKSTFGSLNTDNTTADSILDYGTRNMAIRYNGTLSPTTTLGVSVGLGQTRFNETGFDNFNQITDRRGSDQATIFADTGQLPARANFSAIGHGAFENTISKTKRFELNFGHTLNFWGQHTFGIGYTFQRGTFDGVRGRSGPSYTVPPGNGVADGGTTNVQWRLRYRPTTCNVDAGTPGGCALFPIQLADGTSQLVPIRMQVIRGEFGNPAFDTFSNYNAGYAQDTWRFNKYITGSFGLRWEQERLAGVRGASGHRNAFSLTDQWAPRLGVSVDPFGKGKTKLFYNYGRFFEYVPLDLAERSLSSEADLTGGLFLPEFTVDGAGRRIAVVNSFGTVNPAYDAAHQLAGGVTSVSDQESFAKGTKLGFTDENTFGIEQQLPHGLTFSARYVNRKSKRIIEDAASVSPEAALAGIGQVYYIGNVGPKLDNATNLVPFIYTTGGAVPTGCLLDMGAPVYNYDNGDGRSVCFAGTGIDPNTGAALNIPDGKPDGFPAAVRNYKALELELNKRFSNGWQGFFNWRIASLRGNYEGHLRNDNGQTDPAISSLFDFTSGDLNLLGDQFAIGPLNTDRRHVINVYGSYNFSKDRGFHVLNGLNLGLNTHFETGIPINKLLPHPVYLNAGEIPVGGRGSQGRTPSYVRFDVHSDYTWGMSERSRLKFSADFFNLFNSQKVLRPDENFQLDLGAPNQDFLAPRLYHDPFSMRLGVRWEF